MKIVRSLPTHAGRPASQAASHARASNILARTVEDEVIPRLLQARLQQGRVPQGLRQEAPEGAADGEAGPAQVAALVKLLLAGSQPQVTAYIESLQVCGVSGDSLMLNLLTLAARRLGAMWEEDVCDFTDVTMGVMRLNNVMRLICSAFDAEMQPRHAAPRALLVQAPGEQHGLGLAMVVHFFRRAGWQVHSEPALSLDDLLALVRRTPFGIAGISVSCSSRMDALAAAIADIRRASCNPSIAVMVGGPPFIEHPQLASLVGADATAADANAAVRQAEMLVSHTSQHCPAQY